MSHARVLYGHRDRVAFCGIDGKSNPKRLTKRAESANGDNDGVPTNLLKASFVACHLQQVKLLPVSWMAFTVWPRRNFAPAATAFFMSYRVSWFASLIRLQRCRWHRSSEGLVLQRGLNAYSRLGREDLALAA